MRRIALCALSLFVLGAIFPLACTQDFNQFEKTGGTGASGSTSSSSSSSSSSSGSMCTDSATGCPDPGTKCVTVSCSASHMCVNTDATATTPCSNGGGTVCDGNGTCVACLMPSDCPPQNTACKSNTCSSNSCGSSNTMIGAACTDDMGKVCDGNGNCVGCNSTSDCTGTNVCTGGKCVSATCSDGVKDGDETDIDCGACSPCANTKNCDVDTDCKSGFCHSGMCDDRSQDTDCATGFYCTGNGANAACTAQQSQGSTCSGNNECSSGFCVDGFCCNSSCNGGCQACSKALTGNGTDGQCGDVAAGQDPKHSCTDQGQMSCGHDGNCDGNGACQFYMSGLNCAAAGCSGGQLNSARTCDGMGTCQPPMSTSCAPYASCNGNVCASSCTTSTDCSSGNYCNSSNKCVPTLTNGMACTSGPQCSTTFCVDGFCCNMACTATCMSCGLTGAQGTCSDEPTGTACTGGFCNGTQMRVQCTADAQCMGAGKMACNTTTGVCVQCTGTNHTACASPTGVCDTSNDAEQNTCVACNVTTDCANVMLACSAAHTCLSATGQACSANNTCASGTCCLMAGMPAACTAGNLNTCL